MKRVISDKYKNDDLPTLVNIRNVCRLVAVIFLATVGYSNTALGQCDNSAQCDQAAGNNNAPAYQSEATYNDSRTEQNSVQNNSEGFLRVSSAADGREETSVSARTENRVSGFIDQIANNETVLDVMDYVTSSELCTFSSNNYTYSCR